MERLNHINWHVLITGKPGVGKSSLALTLPEVTGKKVAYLALEPNCIKYFKVPNHYMVFDKTHKGFESGFNVANIGKLIQRVIKSKTFDTLVIDSIGYISEKYISEMKGRQGLLSKKNNKLQFDQWGMLLEDMLGLVMELTENSNIKVIILAHVEENIRGEVSLGLNGQAKSKFNKYFDAELYMYVQDGQHYVSTLGEEGVYQAKNRICEMFDNEPTNDKIIEKNKTTLFEVLSGE